MERALGDKMLGLTGKITRSGILYPRQPADLWRMLLRKFGTPSLTAMSAESGDSPIKNWGGIGYKDFPLENSQKIGAETVLKYQEKKYGCHSCPLRCGGIMRITEGPHIINEMHKPEYETICAFGSLLLNDDIFSIFKLNDLVNRAGMDSISTGSVVAFAMECFENGILTPKETDGLELNWGNTDAVIKLTEMIIKREGIGDILADGVKPASEKIGRGSEVFAVHCGGVEAPMHDPRFDPGFIFSYCLEPTPGRHTISSYQFLDLQHIEKKFSRAEKVPAMTTRKERYRYDNKGKGIAVNSLYKTLIDCAGVCLFGTQIGGNIPLCEWMNAATGWDLSNDDYLLIAERVHQLRHAFNIREAINPIRDFRPHPRLYGDPPFSKGPARKVTLDMDKLGKSYYEAMSWDLDTGRPHIQHLKDLGLKEVIETLYPGGGS
jgi:aldehyde:ferredoxin oxidoreductase